MIRGICWVKVVKKSKGAEIKRETQYRGVISVEDAVGESIRLPLSNRDGVAPGYFAIKSGEAVLFRARRALNCGCRN